jgi:dolichyl-phosphate beta-glucosyltransferase
MNFNDIYLSVIIPAHNEEAVIEKTVNKILYYLRVQDFSSEIIVVDDGSSDKTGQIINQINHNFPHVRLLSNGKCSGKGGAVKKGILNSSGKYILVTDADYTYPIELLNPFLNKLESGTYVAAIGNRRDCRTVFTLTAKAIHYINSRNIISRIFNYIVNFFVMGDVSDTQCGFKCYKSDFIKQIIEKMRVSNFAYDVEMLFLIKKYGGHFCQLPVFYNYMDEDSSVHLFRDSIKMFLSLMSIKIRNWGCLY